MPAGWGGGGDANDHHTNLVMLCVSHSRVVLCACRPEVVDMLMMT